MLLWQLHQASDRQFAGILDTPPAQDFFKTSTLKLPIADIRQKIRGRRGKWLLREAMRGVYAQLFAQSPELHCEIRQRISVGPYVVDEEAITGLHLAGFPTEMHAACVYRVEGDHIVYARGLM